MAGVDMAGSEDIPCTEEDVDMVDVEDVVVVVAVVAAVAEGAADTRLS